MSLRESIGRRKPQQFGSDGRYRALFNGARGGEVEAVSTLLGEGLLVNCAGPRGATPLHIAARHGAPPAPEGGPRLLLNLMPCFPPLTHKLV